MESNGPVSCHRFLGCIVPRLTLAVLGIVGSAHAEESTIVDLDSRSNVERVTLAPRESDIASDEDARHAGPVRALGPSQAFVAAQRVHDAGDYMQAASIWDQIVQQTTPDDLGHCEIAEYQLGVALARLGLPYASMHWFRGAAESPEHAMHRSALVQLGRIAENLSDLWIVLPLFSGYSLAELDRLNDLPDHEKTTLAYLIGRGHYYKGDYARAQQAFARVEPPNPHFLEARLFESASHVRQRHSVPALTSLGRGVAAIERGSVRVLDRQRWLELLHLSQARLYYSSAIGLDPETNIPKIDQLRISAAIKHYNLLEPESEYFQEATFELAWSYFMAGQYTFALGKIFTLDSPYYQDGFQPEAQILKAVLYSANCNYEAATISSARFNKRYIPIRNELKKQLRQFKESEPGRLVRVLEELHHHPVALGSAFEPTVGAAYRQRGFLRMLRAASAIEAEIATFERWPARLKISALGEQLRGELDLRRQEAAARADQWLRGFLQRRVDEIDEHVRNGEKVLIHHYSNERNLLDVKLKSGQVSKVESNDWGRVRGDDEHVIWPFDGEYWRDELGTYRQTVLSTCGR